MTTLDPPLVRRIHMWSPDAGQALWPCHHAMSDSTDSPCWVWLCAVFRHRFPTTKRPIALYFNFVPDPGKSVSLSLCVFAAVAGGRSLLWQTGFPRLRISPYRRY